MKAADVKARRYYLTDSPTPEVVRVTGWADVEVGTGSAKWPKRTERWCRVRLHGERLSSMVVHPSRLVREMVDYGKPLRPVSLPCIVDTTPGRTAYRASLPQSAK